MKIIMIFWIAFLALNYTSAQTVLSDSFNGSSVDTSLWTVTLPESDASVTESNGYVSLENAGRLTTVMSMPTDYEISGSFLMTANPYSNFKVMLRTDGVSLPPPNAPVVNGIEVQFNVQDDPAGGGSTTDNLKIYADGTELANTAANLTLDTWHSFLITDNGNDISLYFDGALTPALSVQSTYSAGDLISLMNREGAGNGSTISANGITEIDYLNIQAVPESSAMTLLVIGTFGLVCISRRKGNCKTHNQKSK